MRFWKSYIYSNKLDVQETNCCFSQFNRIWNHLFKRGLWSILVFSRVESGAAAHDRSGKLEKTSWDMMQQVAPHREEPLLDGNAHSVRNGETIHDGSGKPETLNHQEEADSENFVIGSDAAEFVDKVKDQVRNRQIRKSNVAESGEEHSIIWRNVHGFDVKCGDIQEF